MTDATFSAFAAQPDSEVIVDGSEHDPTRLDRLTARARALAATPGLATWIGVALIAVGAIVVAVGWAKSASLLEVGRQVPYLISAGFTGLGLLVVGVTIVNLSAKVQESARRQAQADELAAVLTSIRRRVEGNEQ